jgi:hypothetical protein
MAFRANVTAGGGKSLLMSIGESYKPMLENKTGFVALKLTKPV